MNEQPLDPSDPLASIETRLRQLGPAALPRELLTRLEAAEPTCRKVIPHPWRWLSLAAAACVALAAWLATDRHSTTPIAAASEPVISPEELRIYWPVSSRNLLINAREIGVITPENSAPVRLVRCLWLDDATYRADDGNSDLQVTRAREQIIPVALEVY